QLCRVEDFVSVVVGNWYFGGRNQIKLAIILKFEQICFKLRQLSRSIQRRSVDNERWQCLLITVFASMNVEHKTDERSFHSRAGSVQYCKTRRSDLRCPLKIKNAKLGSNINMVFRIETKFRRDAPTSYFDVFGFSFSDWDCPVRNIWKSRQ